MSCEHRFVAGKSLDILLVVILFVSVVVFSWIYLHQPGIKVIGDAEATANALIPAMMWALGYGMSSTIFDGASPETKAFIEQERDGLSPSEMWPPLFKFAASGKFFEDRCYALYTLGVFWRIFGVSWDVIKAMLAVMFAIVSVLSYGIFRLGINRGLSLIGAILATFSPPLVSQLPWLRSLGKAPFILAAIFVVGYLFSRRTRPGTFLALSTLLGLILGYGMGFRQDVFICLPPSLAVILIGAQGERPFTWRLRLIAAVLFCGITYVVHELPVMGAVQREVGNNSFYMTQGFATSSRFDTELTVSCVHPVTSNADLNVQGQVEHYAGVQPERAKKKGALPWLRSFCCARALIDLVAAAPLSAFSNVILYDCTVVERSNETTVSIWSNEAEFATRGMVRYLYLTFPADAIARCYGGTARILRNLNYGSTYAIAPLPALSATGPFYKALAAHLHRYGLIYVAGALLILAGIRLRLGFGVFLLMMYFCAYTGIQFQMRQVFHLNLLSFWAPGFLLGFAGHAATCLFRAAGTHSLQQYLAPAQWRAPLRRMLIFSVVAVFMLAAPLYAARAWQYFTIGRLFAQYQQADLEPLSYHTVDADGRHFYCPDRLPSLETPFDALASLLFVRPGVQDVPVEYLALDVAASQQRTSVVFNYENPALNMDGYLCYEAHPGDPANRTFRLFLPVYRPSEKIVARARENQSRDFKGFELGPGMTLNALYRVRNASEFPVLMSLWLPLDGGPVRRWDQLPAFWGS